MLLFTTIFPVLAIEFSDDADYIADGFGDDYEKTVKQLAKAYDWNTEHINAQQWNYAPRASEYLSGILPSVSTQGHSYSPAISIAYRQYSYQDKYLLDNVNTTRAYMGLPPFGYEYANGGSIVAVALAEAEATSRNTEVPIHSNNVCYNTAYYGGPVSGDSYPWCAAFVWWCANQLGIAGVGGGDASSCRTADDEEAIFKKTASSTGQYRYLTESQGFASTTVSDTRPMGGFIDVYPGDIIFFKSSDADKYKHIGIVVGVTEDTIITVEGNYNDHVAKVTYTKNSTNYSFRNGKIVHVEYPASVAAQSGIWSAASTAIGGQPCPNFRSRRCCKCSKSGDRTLLPSASRRTTANAESIAGSVMRHSTGTGRTYCLEEKRHSANAPR